MLGAVTSKSVRSAVIVPFVFPRLNSTTVIDEVRALNRRIKRELVRPQRGGGSDGFDLKNGDLAIGDEVKAHSVTVAADGGTLTINGTIDASGATQSVKKVSWQAREHGRRHPRLRPTREYLRGHGRPGMPIFFQVRS